MGCPKNSEFLRAFLAEGPSRFRARLADHAFDCPACGAKLRTLLCAERELAEHESELAGRAWPAAAWKKPGGPAGNRGLGAMRLRPLAAWAALLAFAVAGGLFVLAPSREPGVRRGPAAGLRLIEPSGTLRSAPAHLAWTPRDRADLYVVRIVSESLETVIEKSAPATTGTRIVLDEADRSKLKAGAAYIWVVEAVDDDGRIVETARASFVIRAP